MVGSGRKYRAGNRIHDAAEIIHAPETQYFVFRTGTIDKTLHKQILMSWQVRTLVRFVGHGLIYWAEPANDVSPWTVR